MKIFVKVLFWVCLISISITGCQTNLDNASSNSAANFTDSQELTVDCYPELNTGKAVDKLLVKMTLEEKIGQMMIVSRWSLSSNEDITTYGFGGLLSGGGSTPAVNTPSAWADMIDGYQSFALKTRLKIPLIYGADGVHGHNNLVGAVIFPHNIGIGATRNPILAALVAKITAQEMAATGVKWTFGPCVAVPQNEKWGRTYEGYSEDPKLVSLLGSSQVLGFQGSDLSDPSSVLATAKHYVGDGGTEGGVDRGNVILTEAQLRATHLYPYLSAIASGAGSVMISYSSWNGVLMHQNQYLITTVLKKELGFKGLVVSDWDAIGAISGDLTNQLALSVNAGIDMLMINDIKYSNLLPALKYLVETGAVTTNRINDAVRRILAAKFKLNLFARPYTDRSKASTIGSAAHRKVARQAVRESLVLLKNANHLLPLKKHIARVHVAGLLANDIGGQCGGWTLSWQGQLGNVTPGTTILQGIQNTVSGSTSVTFSSNGTGASGADVGIVVVGERPYAEFFGDSTNLVLGLDDMQAIENVRSAGVPVVVVLISGRPLIITSDLPQWNACVAAWLPGTEGQGVADVLFGKYKPTGKLPCTWPKSMGSIPVNKGDGSTDYLFPYGYGLTY